MATAVKYTGSGVVSASDSHAIKWVGKTKSGVAVTVSMAKAMNMGNIDWTFAEKDDVVAEIVFTALYANTDATASTTTEPWTIEIADDSVSGASEIVLGAGIFYVDNVAVALTRGGGKFSVEREFREINADGDRGPVEGRVVQDGARATLTMNALTILSKIGSLYSGIIEAQ